MPEVPAVPRSAGLKLAVGQIFGETGPLARVLPGFEPRDGQRRMAEAVAGVLEDGGVLMAEAGTGTGKTLAYLIPAVLSRRRVLVSTGTKNLQEQIYFKDIPQLRRALGLPFTATYMKGRANYLCLHRYAAVRQERDALPAPDQILLSLLEPWVDQTETGDRAELQEVAEDLPLWSELAATPETCLGRECPEYQACFVTRMRQRAAESDVVIVNHHLLCADASVRQSSFGEVIPECHHLVVDEAHQLEEVATHYFGVAVSNYRVDELVRDAERLPALEAAGEAALLFGHAVQRLREAARSFFVAVAQLSRSAWTLGGRLDERIRLTPQRLVEVSLAGAHLVEALQAFGAIAEEVPSGTEDHRQVGRRALGIRSDLEFLLRCSDADFVYFLELRGRGIFLRASPIDVSGVLRDQVLNRYAASVLTSATLSVEGSFEYARDRLGLRGAREVSVPAEFDYARQAILYLPARMPDPRTPGFGAAAAAEVVEILQRTSGRAFVLFTSYATLRQVQAAVEAVLEFPLFVQGSAPRTALLRMFRETPGAVLLATSSFWQGVDVAGDALSCVIIDKLPFASPADPITAARIEALANRGLDPFNEYQVPLAILTLLQGLGRLIRHREDRGVLAILDPRLTSRGYGRRFLASLPPAPLTRDLGDIERFFAIRPI